MPKIHKEILNTSQILMIAVVGLLTLIFLTLAWYVFSSIGATGFSKSSASLDASNQATNSLAESAGEALQVSHENEAMAQMLERMSVHVYLPSGDVTLAVVQDAQTLRERNSFLFQFIKNGDVLLIYEGGFIAYDPVQDKIIDTVRFPVAHASNDTGEESSSNSRAPVDFGLEQ